MNASWSRYSIAILIPSTIHVCLTPVWALLNGQSNTALVIFVWQCIAWVYLVLLSLSFTPFLLILDKSSLKIPQSRRLLIAICVISAALGSYFLFGAPVWLRSICACWFLALLSSACFFIILKSKTMSNQ